ncbi:MAG TPA: zf-HC2 domain-containing protein [Dehalococcoidia bacterium]|nr:zf-HC2 domain-containing protein [Dehalococcoidia bacterium]
MTWFRRSVHPEEDLSAYVDGELGERARRAVETHLASCEACSTLLTELRDTKALLSELPRVEPRRSLALGREFAVERRVVPAPRRMSLSFAPAVALTILVGLLFVDAIDTTGGGSDDSGAFGSAGSTAASRTAEQPEAGTGLALEASKAADAEDSATTPADSAAGQDSAGDGETSRATGGAASAAAAEAVPTEEGDADGAASSALAPPSEASPEPETAPEPLASDSFDDDDQVAADGANGGPEETSLLAEPDDSSGGLSTLRILEIVAALAFAASLLAVFLPRIVRRQER